MTRKYARFWLTALTTKTTYGIACGPNVSSSNMYDWSSEHSSRYRSRYLSLVFKVQREAYISRCPSLLSLRLSPSQAFWHRDTSVARHPSFDLPAIMCGKTTPFVRPPYIVTSSRMQQSIRQPILRTATQRTREDLRECKHVRHVVRALR